MKTAQCCVSSHFFHSIPPLPPTRSRILLNFHLFPSTTCFQLFLLSHQSPRQSSSFFYIRISFLVNTLKLSVPQFILLIPPSFQYPISNLLTYIDDANLICVTAPAVKFRFVHTPRRLRDKIPRVESLSPPRVPMSIDGVRTLSGRLAFERRWLRSRHLPRRSSPPCSCLIFWMFVVVRIGSGYGVAELLLLRR